MFSILLLSYNFKVTQHIFLWVNPTQLFHYSNRWGDCPSNKYSFTRKTKLAHFENYPSPDSDHPILTYCLLDPVPGVSAGHGSMPSLSSLGHLSSVSFLSDEKVVSEVQKLQKELREEREKVQHLSSQLSTNVSC